MPVQRFDHYNLRGSRSELDALRDFYVEVVGLKVGARPPFDRFGYWLYANDQAVLHLIQVDSALAKSPGSFDHAAFACTGIDEFKTRLGQHGIAFRHSTVPLTGLQQLFFQDPSGNGVELNFPASDA